uniref:Uncharacterized protein n=1 Tax=Trichogramma kaykai TaxID=54128 RepID=A0ABD2WAU1_9HYME
MFCETLPLHSIIANKRIPQISAKLRINQNPRFHVYITHVRTDALTRRKEERCSRRVLVTYIHIKLTLVQINRRVQKQDSLRESHACVMNTDAQQQPREQPSGVYMWSTR